MANGTVPCKRPTKAFLFTNSGKMLYMWNRSTLALNNVNYVHAQQIEQATNIGYLQLIASRIYDHKLDDYETLTEISSATQLMTTFVTAMHLSTVGIDPRIIANGAKTSVQLIKTAIHNVIDTAFPIIKWIQ